MGYRDDVQIDDPLWRDWCGLALPREFVGELQAKQIQARRAADEERRRQAEEERLGSDRTVADQSDTKKRAWGEDCPAPNGTKQRLEILRRADVERLEASLSGANRDRKEHLEAKLALLRRRGEYRRLSGIRKGWRGDLDALEAEFPNLTEIFAYLRCVYALAEAGDGQLRLPPMLLVGPPGVGKSHFCERVAQLLGTGYERIDLESAQTSSRISGSEAYWSNSEPGAVYRTLVEGDYADAVFHLDELDKCAAQGRYGSALNALLALLEPQTAKRFRDLSVPEIELDASRLIFIGTANELEDIPEPLLSRMRVFTVDAPTLEQGAAIARAIYQALRAELKLEARIGEASDAVIERLARASPRRVRQALMEGFGRMLYESRSTLETRDIALPPEARDRVPAGFLTGCTG